MSKLSMLRPKARSILVVDDDADIVQALKDTFEASLPGVTVHTAASGQEALKVLESHAVDLILSDYRMPGMDGLDFLTKSLDKSPGSARILMTAYPELDIAVRAINEAQIQNFLTKPIGPDQLLSAINAALLKVQRPAAPHVPAQGP